MTKTFYIHTEGTTTEALTNALQSAGIPVNEVRTTSINHDGIIITELLAKGTWNHGTGQAYCQATPQKPCTHLEWDQLSETQKGLFIRHMAAFLEYCGQEKFVPLSMVEDDEEFEGIRLTKCVDL